MRYYPLFLDMTGRRCIVVGGGTVAGRKVERLIACGATVEVIAPGLTPALDALKREGRIVHRAADYAEPLLQGAFFVIAATDSETVNDQVARDARAFGIPVNVVDDPCRCDFILPAVVERGELVIAVSTGGGSPALAKKIRQELEHAYGQEYGVLVDILRRLRQKVLEQGRPPAENRALFEAVVASSILDLIRTRKWSEIEALIRELTGVELEANGS